MARQFKNVVEGSDLLEGMGELAYGFCREKKYWCANPLNDFFHHSSCYCTTTTLNAKHCSSLVWAKPGLLSGLR